MPGTVTFEWLEGRHFVVQRSHVDHVLSPTRSASSAPRGGDGLVLESFDSRGVRRTYDTSLEGGVWRLWRDAPGFDQTLLRHAGGPDSFEGRFELARVPGEWQEDMRVTYRRIGYGPKKQKGPSERAFPGERAMGLEPTTPGLGSQCSTN